VERIQKGDTDAFSKLYDDLVRPIYRYFSFRVDPMIAEDLTEETFLKIWQNISKYKKQENPFTSWVYRIAHNLVCDHYRKQPSTYEEIDESLADPKKDAHPDHQMNRKLNEVHLREALLKLPDAYQQVITLKYINELENPVIAKTIQKSEGAVRILQFRALKQLRTLLEEKQEDF